MPATPPRSAKKAAAPRATAAKSPARAPRPRPATRPTARPSTRELPAHVAAADDPTQTPEARPGAVVLDTATRAALRAEAHHLKPVVMIGDAGLTPTVLAEADLALRSHQLIKLRVFSDEREQRQALLAELADRLGAAPVQMIGKLLVLWRAPSAEDLARSNARRRSAKPPQVAKKLAGARVEQGLSPVPSRSPARSTPPRPPRGTSEPTGRSGSTARPGSTGGSPGRPAGARTAEGRTPGSRPVNPRAPGPRAVGGRDQGEARPGRSPRPSATGQSGRPAFGGTARPSGSRSGTSTGAGRRPARPAAGGTAAPVRRRKPPGR